MVSNKIAILAVGFLLLVVSPASAHWNNSYYKTPLLVNNTGNATVLIDHQIVVNITHNATTMDTNLTSLHLVNETSGQEIVGRFFIDYKNSINGSYWNVVVNLSSIPASAWDNTTNAFYHRNATETGGSNGTGTYRYFKEVPSVANGWTVDSGTWSTEAKNGLPHAKLVSTGSPSSNAMWVDIGISDNYLVEVDYIPNGNADQTSGIELKWIDNTHWFGGFNTLTQFQVLARNPTIWDYILAEGSAIPTGIEGTLGYSYSSGNVKGYKNKTLQLNGSYVGMGATSKAGLGSWEGTSQVSWYRNFRVSKITGGIEPTVQLGVTEAPFNIITWGNNYTNSNSLSISVPQNTAVNFNITTNMPATYYNATVNGIDQSNNYNNFTLTASSLMGYTVVLSAYNSSSASTGSKTWVVSVTAPTYTGGEGRILAVTNFTINTGVNITINPIQNFTRIKLYNSSESPPNTLEFLINGSTIRFNSSSDKNLSSTSYYPTSINGSRGWNFTLNSGTGTMNVTANLTYYNMPYSIYRDGTYVARVTTNATGWAIYNISGTGGYSIQRELGKPYLILPTNQSTQTITTLPYSQSFVWSNEGSTQYNIQVAKDSGFSIIVVDTAIVGTTTSLGVWDAAQYFWRVRTFDGISTYGTWSEVFNFELTQSSLPSSDGTTGIQGIVYEIKSSGSVVLSNARVTVWNSTWTDSTTTDSNGYYLFMNLANISVYSLKATKDNYEDSNTELVTTTNGTWKIKNIYMRACVSGFNCFYNQKYVNFIVKNPIGTEYNDVAISVYKGSDTTTTYTGTTDDKGSWTELFLIGQEYRITFIKASQNINEEITITIPPKGQDDSYIILVWGSSTTKRTDNISWGLVSIDNNATTTYLNLTYLSNTTTTSLNFWVKNETGTLLFSESTTNVTTWSTGFAVPDVPSNSNLIYVWGFNASHPTWGNFTEGMVVRFKTQFLIDLHINDTRIYTWLSVGFLTLLSLLFSRTTNKYGYILIPLFALFTWGVGWFPQGYQESHFALIMTTLVIGVMAYMRTAEKKAVYPY